MKKNHKVKLIEVDKDDLGYTVKIRELKTTKEYKEVMINMAEIREKYPMAIIMVDGVERFLAGSLTPIK